MTRLLCIDVGNTHTSVGLFDAITLSHTWLLSTEGRRTSDEWRLLLTGLLERADVDTIDGVCICSTVPAVLHALRSLLEDTFRGLPGVVLGPGVRTGLPVLMDNPREVGTDRIANAVAALELVGAPTVVVDLGTATTFDVVSPAGQYVGGVIAPGLEISVAALGQHGAQLRQVELVTPRTVIAKNTVEALQSGAVYGCAGQVDGIVRRIADELDVPLSGLTVIATGVLAPAVLDECETITRYEPDLTLQGLRLVFERNI
ncbi:MAG: type pantothenate kinase [Nocardioidaceae bacterium]|jgi:type III pantothenate kinase|nr:type pantothenate kinase [Nocardioidaceae bacterium]